jgi:O-antigen/teichoic acid export membrane protein
MRGLLRRVVLFALMMVCIAVTYIAIVWYLRDWIFANVIKKDFPQRDLLLTIWSMIFVATVIRDQVIFLPIALGRFKLLAVLTLVCAVLGLSTSFVAIQLYGVAGGLLGLLVGEIAHVVGVALLTAREMRMHTAAQPAG